MPRIVKHPEVRRAEILSEALRIFLARGYENTSLNDLIAEAGFSKGMFYHYFSSKEELLRALFDSVADQTFEALAPALENDSLAPDERLQNVLDRSTEIRLTQVELIRSILGSTFKPEKDIFFQGIARAWVKRLAPALADLIRDGVKQGIFDTFDPDGVAEMHLQNEMSTKDLVYQAMAAKSAGEREQVARTLTERLRLYSIMLCRMLGLEDGRISIATPEFVQRLLHLLNPLEPDPPR
jgi:AcrR family transcriptional regulator